MCSKSTTYLVHSQINFSFTSGGPTYYVYKKAIWLSKTSRCSIPMVITEVKITIKHRKLKFYGQIVYYVFMKNYQKVLQMVKNCNTYFSYSKALLYTVSK